MSDHSIVYLIYLWFMKTFLYQCGSLRLHKLKQDIWTQRFLLVFTKVEHFPTLWIKHLWSTKYVSIFANFIFHSIVKTARIAWRIKNHQCSWRDVLMTLNLRWKLNFSVYWSIDTLSPVGRHHGQFLSKSYVNTSNEKEGVEVGWKGSITFSPTHFLWSFFFFSFRFSSLFYLAVYMSLDFSFACQRTLHAVTLAFAYAIYFTDYLSFSLYSLKYLFFYRHSWAHYQNSGGS